MEYSPCTYTSKRRVIKITYYGYIDTYICQYLNIFGRWKQCKAYNFGDTKRDVKFDTVEEAEEWLLYGEVKTTEVVRSYESKKKKRT